LITVFWHEGGTTRKLDRLDPPSVPPPEGVLLWVDMSGPTPEETRLLTDVFRFHELAVEDAVAEIHHPKIEAYGDYLYIVLHGIDFKAREHRFRTQDVDFFLAPRYLVTVHPGVSRSVGQVRQVCDRNPRMLGEGPAALLHRIVDTMVDNYRPEVDKLQERLDTLEQEVFRKPDVALSRQILNFKRDVASLRRVVLPQRDVVGRLARREFSLIDEGLSYRFRDVYDHLVRLAEEATLFQDRVTSLLDAHLAAVSNQLNGVMKVLTVIATIFMPLTFITGLYGMNIDLPHFGLGADGFFWILLSAMLSVAVVMLVWFRRNGWI
jgi:magnesium transporter